jgi:hypothetical protein
MTPTKCAVVAALVGFGIAAVLAVMAFYPTGVSPLVFLAFCPPSLIAMGIEKAGLIGGMVWWFLIALMNAGLYAVAGWLISNGVSEHRHPS